MSNARIRRLAVLLWSLSFLLLGCGRQDPTFKATPTPSPTGQAVGEPEVASAPASPTLTPTADLEATPLAAIPYPEPRQGSVVTKEPVFDPLITPAEEPLSTATLSALPTEAGTPLPPPYPGAGTQRPESTPANLPPYPVTTRTLTPPPTLEESGPTATTQSSMSPTATSEDGSPTATDQPEVTLTANATSTPTLPPTITPTPRPRIEPRQVYIPCSLVEGQLRCADAITELTFALPPWWVLAISGNLLPGEVGIQYVYDFQRSTNARPGMLQAGGLSRDFSDGREALPH